MTATLTTLDALRRAICAAPEDDIVRGAFADALDERNEPGDAERSEFIRVQCELFTRDWLVDPHVGHTCALDPCELCADVADRKRLWKRERYWIEQNRRQLQTQWRPLTVGLLRQYGPDQIDSEGSVLFSRGFVSEVRAPMSVLIGGACEWCRGTGWHGGRWPRQKCPVCTSGRTGGVLPGIVQREPVTRCVATCREPSFDDRYQSWDWFSESDAVIQPFGADVLPDEIYDLLPEDDRGERRGSDPSRPTYAHPNRGGLFNSEERAHSALSAALLAWGISR